MLADDGRWTMDDGPWGKESARPAPSSIVHRPSSAPRPCPTTIQPPRAINAGAAPARAERRGDLLAARPGKTAEGRRRKAESRRRWGVGSPRLVPSAFCPLLSALGCSDGSCLLMRPRCSFPACRTKSAPDISSRTDVAIVPSFGSKWCVEAPSTYVHSPSNRPSLNGLFTRRQRRLILA